MIDARNAIADTPYETQTTQWQCFIIHRPRCKIHVISLFSPVTSRGARAWFALCGASGAAMTPVPIMKVIAPFACYDHVLCWNCYRAEPHVSGQSIDGSHGCRNGAKPV